MSVNNTPNNNGSTGSPTPQNIMPSNIMQQMQVIQNWVNALVQKFPTAEIVDHDNNSFTIKIRFDDIFRYFYDDVKRSVRDAKVFLKECDVDKEYGQCMVIKTSYIITNLKEIGFTNTVVVNNDGYMLYYVPLKDMLDVFDNMWKEANRGKPVRFEFRTRRITDKETGKSMIYHYIRIIYVQVMKV
ncbi:MAG: hypothetical protein JHC33_08435 [Ignisphaera sp.]|nr:hypothetical protein [Ignisphaera sp.]